MTALRDVLGKSKQQDNYYDNNSQNYSSSSFFIRRSIDKTYIKDVANLEDPKNSKCGWIGSANYRKRVLWRSLNTRLYRFGLISFTLLLLFGAEIRDLVLTETCDLVFDILFSVASLFFLIDITIRVYAEPNYFVLHFCGVNVYKSGVVLPKPLKGDPDPEDTQNVVSSTGCIGHVIPLQVGSFLFWCDVVASIFLLRELSYIDMSSIFEEKSINIQLTSMGMVDQIGGRRNGNDGRPVGFDEVTLLAIVFKSMRTARFIRSSSAVNLAFRMRTWFIIYLYHPLKSIYKKSEHRANSLPAEISANLFGPDASVSKVSWRNVMSVAKAQGGKLKQKSTTKVLADVLLCPLRFLGIVSSNKEKMRRHWAATKIQRAWRRSRNRRQSSLAIFESQDEDTAWKGRSSVSTALEKISETKPLPQQTIKEGDENASAAVSVDSDPAESKKRRNESQVGSAMRELTGQRVAIAILVALVVTVLLSYKEQNGARPTTMMVLHTQTQMDQFVDLSLDAARSTSVPDLYFYSLVNGSNRTFPIKGESSDNLLPREKLRITVSDVKGRMTTGYFSYKHEIQEDALVSILATVFVVLVWFFGVTSFAGPVMILVVIPIERMVRLLGMLMLDPLGYQSTSRYKRFVAEEDEIANNTNWSKEILKGMETSFLMSTISRIGSLMKVGFGSAGVEIIRNNLQKGQTKNMLMLSSQGSTVSCIFLFCDIRQFTDATECLQEEVFVFTNRIAAVVHSICHSYGGSANKNIGDAFLLSWILDEIDPHGSSSTFSSKQKSEGKFTANSNQADKALLSVVDICQALHYDDYYVDTMSQEARDSLLAKLSKRKGPIVQMGFGLHAGNAVQGAIGSTRKIDATYVSEAVDRTEFLESSTKTYGVQMLMSGDFHRLLYPSNRRRCRKVDQILIRSDDDDEEDEQGDDLPEGDVMELFTFDIDIDALWQDAKQGTMSRPDSSRESDSDLGSEKGSRRDALRIRQAASGLLKAGRRRSVIFGGKDLSSDELSDANFKTGPSGSVQNEHSEPDSGRAPAELKLPTGPKIYDDKVWVDPPMRRMRQRYADGLFFQEFNTGLHSFYSKDWDRAKQCFVNILDRFEDGPSRHFLTIIEENQGKPPRKFFPYAIA